MQEVLSILMRHTNGQYFLDTQYRLGKFTCPAVISTNTVRPASQTPGILQTVNYGFDYINHNPPIILPPKKLVISIRIFEKSQSGYKIYS